MSNRSATLFCINHLKRVLTAASVFCVVALAACSDDPPKPSPFALKFAATALGQDVNCTDKLTGMGPGTNQSIGLSDLRFYVSNLRFADAKGKPVALTLDDSEFQYNDAVGSVALIDMTGNTEGSCSGSAISFAEGTARTNKAVTGTTVVSSVASVSFDVGVPQALMKAIIANNTAEGAPSPLNEMYWTWASGYRHFVFNFTVENAAGSTGAGYLHIGSMDCGPADGRALEDRAACGFVNTPTVALPDFDLDTDTVKVDLPQFLTALDFIAPVYDTQTFAVIGEGPGVECHSSPMQPDCGPIFSSVGLDPSTGAAQASANKVFSRR